jgi:hypothetical protein
VEELLTDPFIQKILSTDHRIQCSDLQEFREHVALYADSNPSELAKQSAPPAQRDRSHWPLVRTITIYTTAKILRDGVNLVYLPGTADTNEARVTQRKYLDTCDALCTVSDTTHTITENNARRVSTNVVKRSLPMDDLYEVDPFFYTEIDAFRSTCIVTSSKARATFCKRLARDSMFALQRMKLELTEFPPGEGKRISLPNILDSELSKLKEVIKLPRQRLNLATGKFEEYNYRFHPLHC